MITVIDYGLGNLRSVSKAVGIFEKDVKLSCQQKDIIDAKALVLPGVGAFDAAMKNLEPIKETIICQVNKGKPILGICLGLQLFYQYSSEGNSQGLSLLKQNITAFNENQDFPKNISIPQIGWNSIQKIKESKLLQGLPENFDVYFVHSFYAPLSKYTVAQTDYGISYSAIVEKNNIFATQFHPEKSSQYGLKILKNFICLTKKT